MNAGTATVPEGTVPAPPPPPPPRSPRSPPALRRPYYSVASPSKRKTPPRRRQVIPQRTSRYSNRRGESLSSSRQSVTFDIFCDNSSSSSSSSSSDSDGNGDGDKDNASASANAGDKGKVGKRVESKDKDKDADDDAQDTARTPPASQKRPKSAGAACRGENNKENEIEYDNANGGGATATAIATATTATTSIGIGATCCDAKRLSPFSSLRAPSSPFGKLNTLTPSVSTPTGLGTRSVNVQSGSPSPSRIVVAGPEPATEAQLERLHALSKWAAELHENAEERRRFLKEHQENEEAARWADQVARLEAETDRILAEQKKRDLARLQAQLANVPAAAPKPPKRPIFHKLASFARGRRDNSSNNNSNSNSNNNNNTSPPVFSVANWSPKKSPSIPASFSTSTAFSIATTNATAPSLIDMNFIEQGGKGIVPQIDAPKTAINSGERRVTVQCLTSTINLPVTNDTTPVDIIFSTANLVSHHVNPKNSVVAECYVGMGLERRLRRYERIRDVMNSWDRDQQCSLVVMSYDDSPNDKNLHLESVPKTDDAPMGFTFQMHTYSRPGRWAKRWVTLLDNGQMFSSKKPDIKFTDKDSTPLCHLSDFDIYTINNTDVTRHLRPPKKHCFAIKSQQKEVVFANRENFVHFFSTEDDDLAERFQFLVHTWRSWYLVNKQVDFTKKEGIAFARSSIEQVKRSKSLAKSTSARQTQTAEEDPYLIGDFKPLLDMKAFDKPLEEFGKPLPRRQKPSFEEAENPASRQSSVRKMRSNALPRLKSPPPPMPDPFQMQREFSAGSLLGDTYDKRKHEVDSGTVSTTRKVEGPFTEGPSLLNKAASTPTSPTGFPRSHSWFTSISEHSSHSRPPTTRTNRAATSAGPQGRHPGQPLVDIGQDGSQPPPRRMASKGRAVRPTNGGPLINHATGGLPGSASSSSITRMASTSGSHLSASRQRSRSTAESTTRHHGTEGAPPVPPLPGHRSMRQKMPHQESRRGRDPRPQEPLINRAK